MLYRGKRVRERGRLPKGKFPKKGGRRLVSGLLALVLCLTLVPVIYADTVVTVTSWYAAGAFEENTLYWVDNNNEDGVRPGANTYQPSLWFRIDNGEWIELKGGEDSTLSGVGLSAMPKMTVADNGNNTYTVSVPTGVLPEAIETTTSDGYGGETSTESRVEWIMGPSEGVDGYSPVEVNNGNVSEYPSAGDNYGWYYVLEDEFNFRVQLRWGNLGGAEGIAEAIYNSFDFVVDTNYTASSLRRLLAEMKDQMKIEEDPDGDPDNPTSGTVTVSGLWKYNLDGSRINYSVEETREGDGKGDGRLDAADGIAAGALPEGDYFQISYDNSSTPNVGTEVGKLYDGGSLYLTLTGVKDYQASKVWEDAADPDHRPAGELQLWRYRAGQSYTTAAPVRDDGGSILTVPLNGQEKQDIQFAELPKYDSEGYEYIYVVREYLTGEHAGDYTQVFGAVGEDGGVTDIIWALDEDSGTLKKLTSEDADFARETNNTYLYNGGTLSNKLSGTVTVNATKIWKAAAFQSALEDVRVELMLQARPVGSEDPWEDTEITETLGTEKTGKFTAENLGGGDVQIQDRSERRVSSIQPILTADTKSNSLDFWNLPKYDTNGTVVRYTVEEVWLDGGNEITLDQLRTISPEVYALWNTYTSSVKEESYTANDGENKNDEQKITLTNKRTGVTDAVWYKQWYDIYMYGSGSRPDIYLDIYRTVHTSAAEDGIETELIYPSYRWTNEGLLPPETEAPSEGAGDPAGEEPGTASGDNGSADRQYFWRAELENLPKYDDWGYKITYSAVERTSVNASDFDYAIAEYWTGETCLGTRDEADPGMEAAYEAQTTNLDGVNPPVSQDASSSYAKYALNANGTFVNRLNKPVAIEGRKLWTNLPAGYPAVDLPNVAFALYRRVQGSGEAFDFGGAPIATLTVQDWSGLKNYTFRLLYEGKNIIDDGAGTVRPESEDQPGLPKYTEEGKLYEYVLREEGITGANGLPLDGTGEGPQESLDLFDIQEISNTFQVENVFHSPTGSLSVKKILELPLGGDDLPIAYPAVRFHLYRVYIQNNGQPSAQELVRTATWSSEEVEAAYQQRGDSTTVETVLSFTGLEQYAPNGSLYLYHVEEDKSFLGGYDTWCGPGDLEAQDVTGDGYTVGGLLPHEEREEADATFLNSRKAVQTEFVTLTGQKAWEDFYDAFGLRPDAPYEEGKDGTLVPVIRLTVTRRAAAQEGQGDPHIEEKLTEGGDYTVKWTQDAETGKWTYQIWGADDPDAEEPGISAEEPAEPGPGQGEETTPPTEMPPEEGNQPADPPTDEGDTQSPEPPADGEEDQNPDSQAGDGDGQSAPQEETLSAASLHSDPADGEHGGAGSVPVTPTEPAEDPDQIGDPDSQDPSEETPPAAQPQTELEKWAPNGARWVYTVKEELNSDLKEALYERYQYYFTGNGTAGEDSADGDTIHMKELKNSLETRAPFTKRWVGSDGEPITADYMDLGEMSVTFELYVKEGKSGGWQRAADYFTQENLGEDAYEKLKDAGILNGFSITLKNRHIYDSWSGACENLPRVVKKDSGISELSYRVVETEIAYQGGAATITVDTCGEEFAYTVADSGGLFTGIEDTYTESGNSTTITNKLATTSLQVQKIWTNDRNNVYGTRPDTDEAGKTWETSFLIQRTTDLSVGWEAAAWEAVQVTGENGQKQDLVVTLTGTDTEGTVESPVGMTISGLPKQNAEGEYTYRAVELEPGYQMTNGAVDLSSYVLLRDSYNEAYTAAYTYGGQSDDGFLTTAANDMQTTKVFAGKTWMPAGEEGAQVTLHLQYAVPLENPAEGPAYTWKTLTAVSVTLDGTTDPDLDKPYYEYAEWKAVWENLPARMPGSYLPDSDSETEYRVTEAVSGSYVQVGDTKKENKTDVDGTYPEFQFTNKAVTSLTVEKKWHTADTKKHPITMELWRTTDKNLMGKTGVDGVEQVAGMTAELSAANNWRHIFGELDKVNSQNQKYYYYAIEQGTPDEDMEVIYDHGEPTETTVAFTTAITNRGYTDIPVSKTWRDDSDAQGLRPETLKLTLYRRTDPAAQGEVAGEVTLSAKNAQDGNADVWTYTFEHLPDTDGSGNPYTYWVEEEHLESYTVTGSGTLALTNTLGGKETEIAIQGRKTWVGDGADDRPNSITLSLLQNGTKVAEREVTPNADGSWTYDFGSWPAYDDSGRAYTYTVQEEPVDGYGTRVDGWNVINGKGNLTVKKQVYSGDRQRDFSFTVTLDDKSINGICGDMTFQDGVAAFTLKDGESKTAKGLPSGVGYTVAEARVDGYGTRVEGHNPGMVPFGDTAEVLIINYDDTTPPPDPDPDPDPKPDPDPGPDPMPDPDPHPTPDPDESPDPDMPDTPDEPGHPDEPDDSVPTGDTAQLALYLALLAASLAGAAAIVILGRKGRKRD